MVGARCLIEKKRPAVGAGTIFHYILRASITLNNDVHKIPCAACTKFSSGAGFGSHLQKEKFECRGSSIRLDVNLILSGEGGD